ncbi:MAG: glutathione S-transferase family protein [Hyphomonas sp.]|uniref:glutathione S-transferase family protein n=1 Tax=Hyphomonas sp. TaxID=87 RepID=UPI0018500257|nr:glutathione S-transferase family protein [Hyphomonas sp.]MBU3920822.1 glutathione S-transferase family protein [Alphaproteobacteria bacterium]MBA3068839.1 glutathione S-transferase family protein [Hyphomonas sp.]MBU4062950.1 glutathione S-transferase family protein [Alphaproteobacteria bacterium]MBU4165482.1 glutathione S-transferase family protein [Alphaproteobacteria bacterium]MBU4569386.1 glutathione S-transferase family protein [Alphaproteobacteria bacterium]
MITLFGWGPMFDCPSPSPYVMKSEIQLQMLGVDFGRALADLDSVSKRKAPYLRDGDLLVQDSHFIRVHFEDKLGKSLDAGLAPAQQAAGWALERMVEGHLVDVMVIERWQNDKNFFKGPAHFFDGVPEQARDAVIKEARGSVVSLQYAKGIGRHSEAERFHLAARDIDAVARQLADQNYLFGDHPVAADASVGAVLISGATEFFETPLTGLIRRHANLVAYMDRIKARYFARNLWPSFEMA